MVCFIGKMNVLCFGHVELTSGSAVRIWRARVKKNGGKRKRRVLTARALYVRLSSGGELGSFGTNKAAKQRVARSTGSR